MPGKNDDDLFDGDDAEAIDEFGQLSQMLLERVSEFAEEEDINDEALPLMLLNVAVTLRATAYPVSVAKPCAQQHLAALQCLGVRQPGFL